MAFQYCAGLPHNIFKLHRYGTLQANGRCSEDLAVCSPSASPSIQKKARHRERRLIAGARRSPCQNAQEIAASLASAYVRAFSATGGFSQGHVGRNSSPFLVKSSNGGFVRIAPRSAQVVGENAFPKTPARIDSEPRFFDSCNEKRKAGSRASELLLFFYSSDQRFATPINPAVFKQS